MDEFTIFDNIKDFLAGIFFKLFLLCIGYTKEQYWQNIYEQEKALKENE
jgi:hypothetical protein